jgi:tRNA (guanine10-N2)-dimethyltransferase
MKLGFVLLKTDIEMAKEEVLAVLGFSKHELFGNLLVVENGTNADSAMLQRRLGLTSSIHWVLFSCAVEDLERCMEKFKWEKIYQDNFALRLHHLDHVKGSPALSEAKLAGFIWRAVDNPRVNLKNPKTSVQVFLCDDVAVCTKLLVEQNGTFEQRKPHLRAFSYSGSMHPRLARALVNLSGAKVGETLMDPCCGSGGLLIEAGLAGMRVEGYDINRKMVWGCIRNMAQQNLVEYKVTCKDALQLEGQWDFIATDLPYGLNSVVVGENRKRLSMKRAEGKDIERFYVSFFKKLHEILGKRAVVVLSNLVNGKKLAEQAGLTIEKEFSQYVHRNLTRKILVLTP